MRHLTTILICSLLALAAIAATPAIGEPTPIIAAYLPDYRLAHWSGQTGPVTDLVFLGMSAPNDGRFDEKAIAQKNLDALKAIKAKAKCRLLFTVGGWEKSQGFALLAGDEKLRGPFIREALDFCLKHGFDGIDYDWEHPEGAGQIAAYGLLVKETQAAFAGRKLIVTVALAGWQDLGREAYEAVDRVHLMAYDHDYPQATMEKTKADVQRLLKAGCPAGKIVVGMPFYGRNKENQAKTYAQLIAGRAVAEDVDVIDGHAFNGPATVAAKVRYARQEKLAGVMVWELGQDAAGAQSLLKVIGKETNAGQ